MKRQDEVSRCGQIMCATEYGDFASYYDALYLAQGKNYELEACRLHRLIQKYKTSTGNRLLDVGCGTGEHLRHLKDFYSVEGVDISSEMLRVARNKLRGVPLHQGDMRTFRLGKVFDAVVCLFGSIGYVESLSGLQQAVENMRRHMAGGGVLVIEPWLGPDDLQDGRTHLVVAESQGRKIVRIAHTSVRNGVSEILFHFVVADADGVRYFEERHRLGLFRPAEYREALEKSGLQVLYDTDGISGRGVYIGYLPPTHLDASVSASSEV